MTITQEAFKYVENLLAPLKGLDYHRFSHTQEVYARTIYLAKQEGIASDELEILELASLFHDTGFIVNYHNNEAFWAKIARNFLVTQQYPEDKIHLIQELILATRDGYTTPKNLSEMILKDADMDNLWREDFQEKMLRIKSERELTEWEKISDSEWKLRCKNMLKNYEYFTKTQQKERNETKQANLNFLENSIH